MSRRFDCADPSQREEGINHAVSAIRMGQLIVLPTDTVYGVGADAFDRNAVTDLLLAKGRGRDMPPAGAGGLGARGRGADRRPGPLRPGPDRRVLARCPDPGLPGDADA